MFVDHFGSRSTRLDRRFALRAEERLTLRAPSKYGVDDEGELEPRDLPRGLDRSVGVAPSTPNLHLRGHEVPPFLDNTRDATLIPQSHAGLVSEAQPGAPRRLERAVDALPRPRA